MKKIYVIKGIGILGFMFLIIMSSCNYLTKKRDGDPELAKFMEESINYTQNRDLDGDGTVDRIFFDYTGGGHCCYKMSLKLSSMSDTLFYPFEMDGGYSFAVDGSQPDHFKIEDMDDDGLDEIFMEIGTYNGQLEPLPDAWKEGYGIQTHYLLFDFKDGRMSIRDVEPR